VPLADEVTRFVTKWTPKIDEWRARERERIAAETPEARAARALQQREANAREIHDALRRAGVPPRCLAFTVDGFPNPTQPAVAGVRDYLARWDGRRGLILTGGYGVGKAGLLAAALRQLVTRHTALRHASLHFALAADVFDLLREGYDAGDAAERLGRVRGAGLLALDDLGAEKPTAWVQERLLVIVNHRYERLLPTWITTNHGLKGLAERIGERTVWRLAETCEVIAVTGPNLRARGAR